MNTLKEIILIVAVTAIILVISTDFNKWNCNRVNMDYDIFVSGCVVRKSK